MCTHRILPQKNVLTRVCPPNCTAGPQWCSATIRNATSWCLGTIKSMSRRFSPTPELMLNFSICSRDLKIGLASIFVCSNTNRWYAAQLNNKIHDCQRNMGAELPLFRILHTNPCVYKTHAKIAYVFLTHGFGCKIRNTGRSAPILRWQSCLGAPRGRGYRL